MSRLATNREHQINEIDIRQLTKNGVYLLRIVIFYFMTLLYALMVPTPQLSLTAAAA